MDYFRISGTINADGLYAGLVCNKEYLLRSSKNPPYICDLNAHKVFPFPVRVLGGCAGDQNHVAGLDAVHFRSHGYYLRPLRILTGNVGDEDDGFMGFRKTFH